MKNILSFIACLLICGVLLQYRVANMPTNTGRPLKITEWDAFGYYLYLPSVFIYKDYKELKWCDSIDQHYHLSGGTGLPVQQAENGFYVNKYLAGVAILQLPLFFIGHCAAKIMGYPPDGYSPPYQYALAFGIIFYCFIATLILRKVLLVYFNDFVAAMALILVCLATNFIQYAAVDSGQSHAYIFLLYALILYATIQWHRLPRASWAIVIGYVLGLAAISRPTEAIMLFIPLFWSTHTKEAARAKWQLVRQHKSQVVLAVIAGFLGILPQLIYWKAVSGSWVYDVGSKWQFLTPWFRVLFGFEKGWFIYTPITIFFVAGFFFMKGWPFRKAVLTFCLLNIWIIIAWDDWQYGGSYSTRALVQSYPVFALALAAFIDRIRMRKARFLFYGAALYLLGVNLFQINQYCSTILHFRDMNRLYYSHIYLNPNPSPLDMSLMDTDEFLNKESSFKQQVIAAIDSPDLVRFSANEKSQLWSERLPGKHTQWLKVEATIVTPDQLWQTELNADLKVGDSTKHSHVRLLNPIGERSNEYAFYVKVPPFFKAGYCTIYLSATRDFTGTVKRLRVTAFE